MTITNKTITISLDAKEIEELVKVLEDAVDVRRVHYENIPDGVKPAKPAAEEALLVAKRYRNEFAAIIGKHYMGKDY